MVKIRFASLLSKDQVQNLDPEIFDVIGSKVFDEFEGLLSQQQLDLFG